jgi:prefoldin subunit 5
VHVTTTTDQNNAIALAQLQVEVAYMKAAIARLDASNQELDQKLDRVLNQLAQARGGWRTLMLIGGAAGSIGSGITWLVSHLKG